MARDPIDPANTAPEDRDLFAAFESARAAGQDPLPDLLEAQILRDAADETRIRQAAQVRRPSFWRRVWDEIGGWPTATGLATATAAGLWLGGATPEPLDGVWQGVGLTSLSSDVYFPDYDALFEEI
jgi:hypothetical protein